MPSSSVLSASTPPVDAPTNTILPVERCARGSLTIRGTAATMRRCPTRTPAAALTFFCSSAAKPSRPDARPPLVGLAMKSMAPITRASSVVSAPLWVSVDTMTTGIGRSAMIFFRNVSPSMCGISTSSVTTSGLSALICSRAICGSSAVPTTSISGSVDSSVANNWRITDESSTINTRTGPLRGVMSYPQTVRFHPRAAV
jgi:hypothetical protein